MVLIDESRYNKARVVLKIIFLHYLIDLKEWA